MKKSLVILAVAAVLAIASSAHAQFFRLGSCANGQCGSRYTYSPYYSSCSTGQCYGRTYTTGTCASGTCQTGTCANGSCDISAPTCANGSCSIQSETSTYDIADKLEVTYTHAKVPCQECGVVLNFPLTENAIWSCPKCNRQYATKDGGVYNIVKKNDEGYLTRNGESIPGCTSAECAAKTDIAIQKKLAAPVAATVSTLLNSVNNIRAKYGLCALANDANLESKARYSAQYSARVGSLQHVAGGYEILAQNYQGIEYAITQWLNSPPHRSLLLNGGFRYAGVVAYRDNYGRVWCGVQFR